MLNTAEALGGNRTTDGHAKSSYSAVCGSTTNAANYTNNAPVSTRGIFGYNSAVRPTDVTDGLSKTMMLVERFWDGGDSERRRGGVWVGKVAGSGTAAGNKYSTMVRVENLPDWVINGSNNNAAASTHGGAGTVVSGAVVRGGFGANVVMADGSVRLISENVNGSIWQLLGQRADGQSIADDF